MKLTEKDRRLMKKELLIVYMLCILVLPFTCPAVHAKTEKNRINLKAAEIQENGRLVNLRFYGKKKMIGLDDTLLTEDDAPATGQPEGFYAYETSWMEDLRKSIVIRKTLILDSPKCRAARVVFLAKENSSNTEPLYISINGEQVVRQPSRIAYPDSLPHIKYIGNWFYVDLPIDALKKGENEVKMWSNAESNSWLIFIADAEEFARGSLARTEHPNRSSKSSDGGKTWNYNDLGTANVIDGEYSIRISQDRYVPSGKYVSPVIDLVENNSVFKRNVTIKKSTIKIKIDTPKNTCIKLLGRWGQSPLLGHQSWSEWLPIEPTHTTCERYFQYKALLTTKDPLKTPSIKALKISTEFETLPVGKIDIKTIHNGIVIQPSYAFGYEDLLHPGLEKFRKNHMLDKIVEGATTEFEIFKRLLNWGYKVPVSGEAYCWDYNKATVVIPRRDMPYLHGSYTRRRRNGAYTYGTQALMGGLISMGYQARHVNINTTGASGYGHGVVEVWSNQFNKWIMLDPVYETFYFDPKTNIPLGVLELHDLLTRQYPGPDTWQKPFAIKAGKKLSAKIDVGIYEGCNNQYPIEEKGRHVLTLMGNFRIIPRNDFLSNPLPIPIRHGYTSWGWDGYLNYYDHIFGKRYEFQRNTDRPVDFYAPLNQSQVFLTETEKAGVLKVEVDTFGGGGFDTFLVRVNDGQWAEQKESQWMWNLIEGQNKIEVKAKNVRDITGPPSILIVTCTSL